MNAPCNNNNRKMKLHLFGGHIVRFWLHPQYATQEQRQRYMIMIMILLLILYYYIIFMLLFIFLSVSCNSISKKNVWKMRM